MASDLKVPVKISTVAVVMMKIEGIGNYLTKRKQLQSNRSWKLPGKRRRKIFGLPSKKIQE